MNDTKIRPTTQREREMIAAPAPEARTSRKHGSPVRPERNRSMPKPKPADPFAFIRDGYPALVTYAQAAEIVGVSERTLTRMPADELPVYRVGSARAYRLRLDDVLNLLTPVA